MSDSLTILRILSEIYEDDSGEEISMGNELVDDSDEDPEYVPHEHNCKQKKIRLVK